LTGDVYSTTAAELFWAREDASLALNYEIRQNGDVVATTDGVSYFTASLDPGTDYTFEVIAIDQQGLRSEAMPIASDASPPSIINNAAAINAIRINQTARCPINQPCTPEDNKKTPAMAVMAA